MTTDPQAEPLWHGEYTAGAAFQPGWRYLILQRLTPAQWTTISRATQCFFGIKTNDPAKLLESWPTTLCYPEIATKANMEHKRLPNVAAILTEHNDQAFKKFDKLCPVVGLIIRADMERKPDDFTGYDWVIVESCTLAFLEWVIEAIEPAIPVWVGEGPFIHPGDERDNWFGYRALSMVKAEHLQVRQLPKGM